MMLSMNDEQSKNALAISAILFKNNVPIDEAKIIGNFIENLCMENNYLKQALINIEKLCEKEIERGTFDTNDDVEFANIVVKERFSEVLSITDKALGSKE